MSMRSIARAWVGGCVLGAAVLSGHAGERLALRHVQLDLPGPPSRVIAHDVDGDGRLDLAIVVAYSEFDEISEDRVENMIQFSTVIPAIFDRRELRVFLDDGMGAYRQAGAPLPLPPSVLHLEAGPSGAGLLALTDDGVSRITFRAGADGESPLALLPWIDDPPLLARTGSFHAALRLVHDLNGDGVADLLLPGRDDFAVYLGGPDGLARRAAARVARASQRNRDDARLRVSTPMPRVADVDGDGIADLVFQGPVEEHPSSTRILLGTPSGAFRPLRVDPLDCHDLGTDLRWAVGDDPDAWPWPENLEALVDLDGDGRVEAIVSEERSRGDGFRAEMKDAKRPINRFRFHRLTPAITVERASYYETEVEGHSLEGGGEDGPGAPIHFDQFRDLDGDGLKDLITVTMDFSIFQALKIVATKRISIGLDFHVYAQHGDGSFHGVPDLDLSEKLKIDLNDLAIGRFGQFAGDFDGDGRQDFVHLGRGRDVTIHAGEAGCRYPRNPNLTVRLDAEPEGLDLIRIEDLDGDGRSDIRVTRPLAGDDPDLTAPVRLDLYLSGGVS